MKIAIMHDYFDEIGGAEITLLILARALKATIITTNIDKRKILDLGFSNTKFISIGKVPHVKYLKQFVTKYRFWKCNFNNNFDFFIFGGFCSIYASIRHKNNIWYCFSPERGLYDLRYYYTSKYNIFVQLMIELLIILDKNFAKYINKIIAPSKNIQLRIKKYYNRASEINYSPITIDEFYYRSHKNYWLCVTRIDPYKRLELQLRAFKELPEEKLYIIGNISKKNNNYYSKLKKTSVNNVKFTGGIFKKKLLAKYYANCKGFITTSLNEDFGMNVVEAMASGKPVIAPNEGGYKETIIDGITGKLINNINVDKLVNAIKEVGKNPERYKKACVKQSKKFDTKIFIKKMIEEIKR